MNQCVDDAEKNCPCFIYQNRPYFKSDVSHTRDAEFLPDEIPDNPPVAEEWHRILHSVTQSFFLSEIQM